MMGLYSSTPWPRLGILGGGQLGRMLLESAARLPLNIAILDPDPNAPCSTICTGFRCGDLLSEADVLTLSNGCDILTIEIEAVNTEALRIAESRGVRVYPRPETVRIAQDKGLQKHLFDSLSIPTAPYTLVTEAQHSFSKPLAEPKIFKLRRGGYDGRGVAQAQSLAQLPTQFHSAPCVVEERIAIAAELAIMVARNPMGQLVLFPPVEMVFDPQAHLVRLLLCPARISEAERAILEDAAQRVAKALDLVGVLALEFFKTTDGAILINEIAPRPHNSGHHTIKATTISQFDAHLRAILGHPLIEPALTVGAATMVNILGKNGYTGVPQYPWLAELLAIPGVTPHIYGKRETRPMRKLGHITITGTSEAEVLAITSQVERIIGTA